MGEEFSAVDFDVCLDYCYNAKCDNLDESHENC